EDNEINQQIAVELLEGVGAQVEVAGNGRIGAEKVTQGGYSPPYDVVLMDLQMPALDGFGATAKIRADARFDHLPIIAMTAHATGEGRRASWPPEMKAPTPKPIVPAALFAPARRHYRPPHSPIDPAPSPNGPAAPPTAGPDREPAAANSPAAHQ